MLIGGRVPPVAASDGGSIERYSKMVRMADGYGYTMMWGGWATTAHLGYAASITNRVRLGPRVVNPLIQEPGVIADGLGMLHVISSGRAFMVLGRGDGVVRNHGLKEASVQQIKEFYLAVRDLLDHGETVYKGRTILLYNPDRGPFWGGGKIPLYILTAGPRTLKMAAGIADGIWLGCGLTPEAINGAMAIIREGAEEAGRDVSDIDIWWVTRSSVGRTHEEAVEHAKESLASIGNHSLRGGFEGKNVPEDMQPKIQRYHELYDWREKGMARGNVATMEKLGLLDYFMDRFGVIGTPDEVVERLKYLETLGVKQCEIGTRNVDTLRLIGEEVLPAIA